MQEAVASPLAGWESFYVIVGSSAGALTGLQFVVITLIAERRAARSMREVRAFGTPTVMHFCAALLISAILSAPWTRLQGPVVILAASGLAGVIYALTVIRHARLQSGYSPEASDWFWYAALPLAAYAALFGATVALSHRPALWLYAIAVITLVLLFIGIHNSWDTVTYIAIEDEGAKNAVNRSPAS